MRRDPFKDQKDMSGYPKCIACISYCPMKMPWQNPEGKLEMRCSSPKRIEIFKRSKDGKVAAPASE